MSRRTNRVHPAAQRAAREANEARADERAAKLAPILKELQASGVTSLCDGVETGASLKCRIEGDLVEPRWSCTDRRSQKNFAATSSQALFLGGRPPYLHLC
jgi:hypothetical protein